MNIRLLLKGKVYLVLGIPLQVAGGLAHGQGGLVHAINSASELRAIDKHTGGVEDKGKAIIARFDIGVVLPLSESGAVLKGWKTHHLIKSSLTFFTAQCPI